jgi:hypothetical protein
MAIVKPAIERKLSSLLGATVTLDKLNVSLLGGSIEAAGVTIRGVDCNAPFATIALVRAEVSRARALKGEIAVKSLTVERPVLNYVECDHGAASNFPRRPMIEFAVDEHADEAGEKTSWKLDVEKVLLVDGQAGAKLDDGYEISTGRILAQLNRDDGDYVVTFLAEGVARRDKPADVGTVGVTGRLTHVPSIGDLGKAGLMVDVQLGDFAQVRVTSPTLRPQDANIEFEGKFALARVLALLPPAIAAQLSRVSTES